MDEGGRGAFRSRSQRWVVDGGSPGRPRLHLRTWPEAGRRAPATTLPQWRQVAPKRSRCSLWVPSDKGIDEWGGQHIRMTGIFHPVLLWPHVLSCSLWYYITFPKMVSIRMERERICRNVYLSTAHKFRTPWIESCTPQNESREEEARWGSVTGPRNAVPPQGHLAQIFLYQVISAQLPYGSPGLLCSFTVRFL